jgi:C_GCAxxG_C_C family probable redox protein
MKWLKQLVWDGNCGGKIESFLKQKRWGGIDPVKIRARAEPYYRSGDFFCSEAIVKAVVEGFHLPVPDLVIAMASGFPVGIGGSGCTCGALTGGVMALGLFFGRTEPKDRKVKKCMELSKLLHDRFQDRHVTASEIFNEPFVDFFDLFNLFPPTGFFENPIVMSLCRLACLNHSSGL